MGFFHENSSLFEFEMISFDLKPNKYEYLITRSLISDYKRLFASIVFSFTSFCYVCLAMAYTTYKIGTTEPFYKESLSDLIIDNFETKKSLFIVNFNIKQISEICCFMTSLIFLILIILHKRRLIIVRRFLVCMGIIFCIRGSLLISTQLSLPHSPKQCPKYVNLLIIEKSKIF